MPDAGSGRAGDAAAPAGRALALGDPEIAAASRSGSWWIGLAGSTRSSRTSRGRPTAGRRPAQTGRTRGCPPAPLAAPSPVVGQDDVDDPLGRVALERLDVVGQVEALGLAGLGGHVADVDPRAEEVGQGSPDVGQEQARQDARVQAARADHDQVGLGDRGQGVLARRGRRRGSARPARCSVVRPIRDWPSTSGPSRRSGRAG